MPPSSKSCMPRFPLTQVPSCLKCGDSCERQEPYRKRAYYNCPRCSENGYKSTWCTYDDDVGVSQENSLCHCGLYCRMQTDRFGQMFARCAIGQCEMSANWKQSLPNDSGGRISTSSAATVSQPSNVQIDQEFVRLLDHVMCAAGRAHLPSHVMDMSDMRNALLDYQASPRRFQIHAPTNFDRNSKIGAAGELYMVTLLQRVLNGEDEICKDDWASNMRNLVKQHHPGFAKWPEWNGRETADIVFPDSKGVLTDKLIKKGYLDRDQWCGQTPTYLIEVKSSLSDKNREFYLSDLQYRRMQEYSTPLPSSTTRPTIYMIARVSNLQENEVGLRLYLDPETLRQDRKLRFRLVYAVEEM